MRISKRRLRRMIREIQAGPTKRRQDYSDEEREEIEAAAAKKLEGWVDEPEPEFSGPGSRTYNYRKYGNPHGPKRKNESKMRIRKGTLKRIIKEEYRRLVRQGLVREEKEYHPKENGMDKINLLIQYAKENGMDENSVSYSRPKSKYLIFNVELEGKVVFEMHQYGNIYSYKDPKVKAYFYKNDAKIR